MVYQGKSSFVPQVKHKQQEEIKDILKNKRSRGCLHQQKSSYLELSTTQYIYVINLYERKGTWQFYLYDSCWEHYVTLH